MPQQKERHLRERQSQRDQHRQMLRLFFFLVEKETQLMMFMEVQTELKYQHVFRNYITQQL